MTILESKVASLNLPLGKYHLKRAILSPWDQRSWWTSESSLTSKSFQTGSNL